MTVSLWRGARFGAVAKERRAELLLVDKDAADDRPGPRIDGTDVLLGRVCACVRVMQHQCLSHLQALPCGTRARPGPVEVA